MRALAWLRYLARPRSVPPPGRRKPDRQAAVKYLLDPFSFPHRVLVGRPVDGMRGRLPWTPDCHGRQDADDLAGRDARIHRLLAAGDGGGPRGCRGPGGRAVTPAGQVQQLVRPDGYSTK